MGFIALTLDFGKGRVFVRSTSISTLSERANGGTTVGQPGHEDPLSVLEPVDEVLARMADVELDP
jgi:hypothetical protein